MKKVCWSVLSIIIFLFLLFELASCGFNTHSESITINEERFSLDDFFQILINDEHRAKQYIGQEATVTGEIKKKSDGYNQTNLGRYIGANIEIGYNWTFVVDASVLDDLEIGDTITIKAKISYIMQSHVFCWDGCEIISK